MKFYRKISPIKAISFDLDDTLYSNRPVMVATEKAMPVFFAEQLSSFASVDEPITFDSRYWWPFRTEILSKTKALIHDVTALRLATYQAGIQALGASETQAKQLAEQAMAFFLAKRSEFDVPQSSIDLLTRLRKHVPVVAVSNGNVDTKAIGIHHLFDHIFHAGNGLAKKPDTDMFFAASEALSIPCQHILHVGDCGHADILGAHRAGMQTAWLSCYDVGKPIQVLPHIELDAVSQLNQLF